MNEVSFYGGLALLVIGLCVLLFSHRVSNGESAIEFAGFAFRSRAPAFIVMAFGVVLMLISTRFPPHLFKPHELREFSQDGDMADYSCGSHGSSQVTFRAPPGYKVVNAQPDTKDVVSTKTATAKITSQDDHVVTARAEFDGKDNDTFGLNCPGGGHGRVTVRGQIIEAD
jgi:hypothetical protein